MVRKVLIGLAASSMLFISACNTIHGMGKDVESVGDTVADAAK